MDWHKILECYIYGACAASFLHGVWGRDHEKSMLYASCWPVLVWLAVLYVCHSVGNFARLFGEFVYRAAVWAWRKMGGR